ncbi:MAG: cob(I)yrinic acid a,c-diamide adenosyltransferase [Lachnospiraceae bacterium]|nr:cob(I)yrinic acid a,c-diamide adenosyltransferase [Lachnospiraceae bacterium]
MRLRLIRHGETEYNKEKRYQGQLDIPLSPEGIEGLLPAGKACMPEKVYTTHLSRAAQTAQIIFPGVPQTVVKELAEMNFGEFEGKSYAQMEENAAYWEWVDSGGESRIPGGESRDEFVNRIAGALIRLVAEAEKAGEKELCIVAHGGTVMAAQYYFEKEFPGCYHEWLTENGGGYEIECGTEGDTLRWRTLKRISYAKGACRTHLYFGEGRGKSSICSGTALRALAAGREVHILRFCKAAGSGEDEMLSKLGAKLYYGEDTAVMPSALDEQGKKKVRKHQNEQLWQIMDELRNNKTELGRMLILDEACAAVEYGLLDEAFLKKAVLWRPARLELMLSGRNPSPWMKDAADYLTELNCLRHPYEEGIDGRKGIEW